ncbi:MAG: Low-molecular weight cobalt-containing nitrile hydratase subunit alpha [Betaproteobacteria bacterium]|jgi:nitrile hydratase|nr:Low-molecular weight cobalt-containing nitrile hydratase subunit alpha [Betaproteobacteria bacterium]
MSHDHHHDHGDHAHGHRHPNQPDHDDALTYYRKLEMAVRELLIEKNIISADEVRKVVEDIESRSPEGGARVVARAWSDPQFRQALLEDATAACTSMGFEMALYDVKLTVVENTPDVHNMVVCTLCSCYPRMLLGLPPAWYKSRAYRSRAVREPRAVLREFGLELGDDVSVRVHDSTADLRYLVLPMRPEGTERMTEAELIAIVNRDSMIGTAIVSPPIE